MGGKRDLTNKKIRGKILAEQIEAWDQNLFYQLWQTRLGLATSVSLAMRGWGHVALFPRPIRGCLHTDRSNAYDLSG